MDFALDVVHLVEVAQSDFFLSLCNNFKTHGTVYSEKSEAE